MSTNYKFQGWMGLDKSADQGNMKWQDYEPKKWEESDVDIQASPPRGPIISGKNNSRLADHTLRHLRIRSSHSPLRLGRVALSMLRGARDRW